MIQLSDAGVSTTVALGPSWLDPEKLIQDFGFIGILLIVFAECGLLFGIILPGDSLLFTAGLLLADNRFLDEPLWLACLLLWVAAVAGNLVGYEIGRRAGPAVFNRPNSRIFKQSYVERTGEFFDQHGGRAIMLARFVPIVRTLIPVFAGVCKMDRRTFAFYSVIGGALWASGLTALGYWLGGVDFVKDNLEFILIGIVAASWVPIVLHFRAERARAKAAAVDAPEDSSGSPEHRTHGR
ncbi:MAG: DedA family protein [Sporichthyaceae bacterium]